MSKETATTSTSANKRPTLLQLKISLAGTYPPIWRRIQIPWDFSFEDLHDTIIDTMGWLHAGEHYFEMKNQQNASIKIGPKSEEEDQENVNPQEEQNDMKAEDVETLRDYFTKENNMCHYYLSGSENSSWLHTIKLEKMVNSRVNVEYPRVIAGNKACPPVEVGSVNGYKALLKIIKNPDHPEFQAKRDWLNEMFGHPFNPDEFSVSQVTLQGFTIVYPSK